MNKKGFTLMEMLIVIAIIAILIAIAIPTFTAALEKSRQKTDLANARALKSLVVAQYMAGEKGDAAYDAIVALTGDAKAKFYLNKNGQELMTAKGDNSMPIQAKWDKAYDSDKFISCTFDATCKMTGSCPKLDSAS